MNDGLSIFWVMMIIALICLTFVPNELDRPILMMIALCVVLVILLTIVGLVELWRIL